MVGCFKKGMKKKILSLWLATALVLTGCGDKGQDVENPAPSVTPQTQDNDTNTEDNQQNDTEKNNNDSKDNEQNDTEKDNNDSKDNEQNDTEKDNNDSKANEILAIHLRAQVLAL